MNPPISPVAQIIIAVIPIAGIAIAGAVILLAILWSHTERKMRIQNGIPEPHDFNQKAYILLIALLLTAVGFALTVFFIILTRKSNAILGGLIPLASGIALLVFYKMNDWKNDGNQKSENLERKSDKN